MAYATGIRLNNLAATTKNISKNTTPIIQSFILKNQIQNVLLFHGFLVHRRNSHQMVLTLPRTMTPIINTGAPNTSILLE